MRSFVAMLQIDGARPDASLLHHLGTIISLDGAFAPALEIDAHCGIARIGDAPQLPLPQTEFSFAIWDAQRRELFGARDRFGARPFYYARTPRAIVCSDSLEAVIAHPDVRVDALDERAVADYLASGVLMDPEATIYANVRRLAPAHTVRCDPDGRITLDRYWTLPARAPRRRRDAAEQLEAALKSAIADRVNAPSAMVFMSGGLDSPLLAALTREVRPNTRLLAGTSVYRMRIADVEEPFADEAARSIGIPIEKFVLDEYPPLQALDEDVWTAEPGPMLTAPMTREIYRAAAKHAPIALHGHPADAVFSIDLTSYLRALPWRERVSELLRYTVARRRPPYFYFRPRRPSHDADALASPIWSSYFEWAHPQSTRAPIDLVYPWCDARVIEAARALEPIPWLVDKQIARELLRGRLSERVRTRRKAWLGGDPWRAPIVDEKVLDIEAASAFVDPLQFRKAALADGFLSDRTLRTVVFESWLRKLPRAVARLRHVRP
jgi:asparagine synthase (glutamine-hydrolysing)